MGKFWLVLDGEGQIVWDTDDECVRRFNSEKAALKAAKECAWANPGCNVTILVACRDVVLPTEDDAKVTIID